MHSTDLWTNAWTAALPAWQAAVRLSGWHPVLAATAHAAVALMCLAAGRSARAGGRPNPTWPIAAGAMLLLAVNTLFALDLLGIEVLRGVARASGWYAARREVQVVALVATGMVAVAIWTHTRHRRASTTPGTPWLVAGLGVLVGLATLHAVSLHATDELINSRLVGLSLGLLVDALGLGLMAASAWCELRDPCAARA